MKKNGGQKSRGTIPLKGLQLQEISPLMVNQATNWDGTQVRSAGKNYPRHAWFGLEGAPPHAV